MRANNLSSYRFDQKLFRCRQKGGYVFGGGEFSKTGRGYWRRKVTGNFLMKGFVLARAEHIALV
jgi:hypothetical protein